MDQHATRRPRSSFSCGGHVHRCQLVFTANADLSQGKESNMSLISWHPSRLTRVARSSFAAATQTAADGDDETVHIHLCPKEVLSGQLGLQNWQSETRQTLAALAVDCRGVYDSFARSSSGLAVLALKKSLVDCGTMLRWCHSAAQLGDFVTKDSDTARAPWELFVRRKC